VAFHMLVAWIVAFLVSFGVSALIVRLKNEAWLDQPNERSLHDKPISRLGGVGIWSGVAFGSWMAYDILQSELNIYALLASIVIFLVALVDDRKNISPVARLFAQILAVSLIVFGGHTYIGWSMVPWIWPWLGMIILLWGINLYNFMDGMDGFAGAMAVVGFGALAVLAVMQDQLAFSFYCALLVAASLGFLCWNFPPARIFMGDSGSTVMGFMMGAISIAGWQRELYGLWVPLVIFSPFWVDATLTLIRRLIRGERVWEAHRQHFYQQCVLAGLSHRRVLGGYIVLMLLCSVSAICGQMYLESYNACIVPACWLVFYLLIASGSNRIISLLKTVS